MARDLDLRPERLRVFQWESEHQVRGSRRRSEDRDLSPDELVELILEANCDRDTAVEIASNYAASKRRKLAVADSKGHVPSDMTVWSVFSKYVGGSQPVFKCHRLGTAGPPIPLILLHKAFKKFYDDLKQEPGAADMKFACEYWADLNSADYVLDHERAVARIGWKVSAYFNQHFREIDDAISRLGVAPEAVLPDGTRIDIAHLKGPYVLVSEEHKPQAASGEPAFQNMDYFRRVWSEEPEQGYAILVNTNGPRQVEVMAASLQEGNKVVWAETLATFSCHHNAKGRLAELVHTARVWKAIKAFAVSYVLEKKQQGEWPLPWCVRDLPNVTQLDREKLVYTYDEVLQDGGTRKVVAKVTDKYSEEAHKAWEMVAPELYHVEDLDCLGWKVIHMEYLQPSVWKPAIEVLRLAVANQVVDSFKTLIKAAAEVGHKKGFVHGDFRLDNLLVRQSAVGQAWELRVLDFDWAGKVGEVKFRVLPNPAVKWYDDTFWGRPITEEHDLWFAGDGLLPQLESSD